MKPKLLEIKSAKKEYLKLIIFYISVCISFFTHQASALPSPIISCSPSQNMLNVPKDADITVTFDTEMNASTDISNFFNSLTIYSNDPGDPEVKLYLYGAGVSPIPACPQNLNAIPGFEDVTLRWNANSETDVHKYNIYRDITSPAITLTDSIVASSPPDTFFIDTELTNGQEYFYRITAVDSSGNESDFSDEVNVTPYQAFISYAPSQNRLNVPVDTVISVTFGTDVNPATINSNTFIVYSYQTGLIEGTYSYNGSTRTATFDPDNDFKPGELVTIILTTEIQTSTGYSIHSPIEWSFTIQVSAGYAAFLPNTDYSIGKTPRSVFSSDLDNDGDMDLAVANSLSNKVSVLMNNGNGTFQPKTDYSTGSQPFSVFSSDLDADGDLDLAVANYSSGNNVSILLNNGNGTFQPRTDYTAGNGCYSVFSSDLDNDGDMDLAVANHCSHNASVLLNNGDGTFQPKTDYPAGEYPGSIFSSDLDNDGDMDLAIANYQSDNVSVLLNNSDGTFQEKTDYPAGNKPHSIFSADLDSDSDMDLVVTNHYTNNVSILRNNGNGTFQPKIDYPAGDFPNSVFSSDLDADGDMDLAVANKRSDNISVLLNNGDGTFQPKTDFKTGNSPSSIVSADFDSDGDLDLGVVNHFSEDVSILLSCNGEAYISADPESLHFGMVKLGATRNIPLTIHNYGMTNTLQITDITSSNPAFVTSSTSMSVLPVDDITITVSFTPDEMLSYSEILTIYSNDPDNPVIDVSVSGYGYPLISHVPASNVLNVMVNTNISVIFSEDIIPGSLNSNTFVTHGSQSGLHTGVYTFNSGTKTATFYPDSSFACGEIITVSLNQNIQTTTTGYLPGNYEWSFTIKSLGGSGTFLPKTDYATGGHPYGAISAILNNDNYTDLAIPNLTSNNASIILNNGDGTFQAKSDYTTGTFSRGISSADFDKDGDMDLAVANTSSQSISILMNNGDGTFQPKIDYTSIDDAWRVYASDLNADGYKDLVVVSYVTDYIYILINNCDGTFQPTNKYLAGSFPTSAYPCDLDLDGDMDLAVSNSNSDNISILLNNGNSDMVSFAEKTDYQAGNCPQSVFSCDLDSDGDMDLAVANALSDNVSILLNNGDGTFQTRTDYPADDGPYSIFGSDLDSDGDMDLAVSNSNSDNISILLNNGNGTFQTRTNYATHDNPHSVFASDFDSDGDMDLVTANLLSDDVSVLLNRNREVEISVSTDALYFGNVETGSTKSLKFLIYNNGFDSTLQITNIISSNHAFVPNRTTANIQAGSNTCVTVYFSPTDRMTYTGDLSIYSNDPDENPYIISLTGRGVEPDISASPNPLNYGTVNIDSTSDMIVHVSNNGNSDLNITSTTINGTGADQFSIQNGGDPVTISPGGTHNIVIRFSPSSIGSINAILSIASNDPDENPYNIPLTGTGMAPDIDVSPVSGNYGNVIIGEDSTLGFTVTNTGNTSLIVTSTDITGANTSEFSITSGGGSYSLNPGEIRIVIVSFNPASVGVKSASLHIESNDPDENPLDIALIGAGVIPDISVNPEIVNYGEIELGDDSTKSITVSNTGSSDLIVNSTNLTGTNAGDFSITSGGGGFTLAPGEGHTIHLKFTPASFGEKIATLNIFSNDPDENPANISLAGTCIVIPDIDINPGSKDYGDVGTGASLSQTFTITNNGTGDLAVNSTAISGTDAGEFNIISVGGSVTISPSAGHELVVQFNPSSAGLKSATLTVISNDPDEGIIDISLSGNGVIIPVPDILVEPSSYDYDDVPVDSTEEAVFTISNNGTADLIIENLYLDGPGIDNFSIVETGLPVTILPGSTSDIAVLFTPYTSGLLSVDLNIESNDPDTETISIPLTGTGIELDSEAPYLAYCYPYPGVSEVIRNTSIQIRLEDDGDGLDIGTLDISVNGSLIVSGGIDQTGGNTNVAFNTHFCNIYYTPENDFPENLPVILNIECEDLSLLHNEIDTTISFNVGKCISVITKTSIIKPNGGIVSDESNDIEINIPENALEDSIYITIGLIESLEDLPDLPDTVSGMGVAYHFGPDGLKFNTPVIISIPYTQEDLDNAGVTDPMDLPVFYFSSSARKWTTLEITSHDAEHIFVAVDEFCYIVFEQIKITGIEHIIMDSDYGIEFVLYQNYPNPFIDKTTISFSIPKSSYVIIKVYDINIKETEVLVSREFPAGKYDIMWNADKYPSGVYIYQLQINEFFTTRKLIKQ